jgi:cytidyltransferase-like protein
MIQKISWPVIHGDALGRKIGFRTANIDFEDSSLGSAVFKVNIVIKGELYTGMWVNAVWKKMFEVHIFNFDADIYGEQIEIYVLKKIRDNRKFESLESLTDQLQKDKENIEKIQLNTLTFWSFDFVHKGHEYYLREAKNYGDFLITIIATDTNIERIKGRRPLHSQEERQKHIEALEICDEVIIGSEISPMKWLEIYRPYSICLGYDQRGKFVDELPRKLQELWMETEILHISALEPETYKSSLLKKEAL